MKSIKRESLTDRAIKEIKGYLMSGELKFGEKLLTEVELSERLGVGRSTVREAMRTLSAMGYIEMKTGKGAFAAITTKEEELRRSKLNIGWFESNKVKIYEWQEARLGIEPYLAELAARRGSQDAKSALSRNITEFEISVDGGNLAESERLECEFHSLISEMADNPILREFYSVLYGFFAEFVTNNNYSDKKLTHTAAEHRKVAEAVILGDGAKARKAMEEHLTSSIGKLPV